MAKYKAENIIKGIENILLTACNKNIFSASSVAFFDNDLTTGEHYVVCCGTTDESKTVKIDYSTLFDLASLTKPLVTLLTVLVLIERDYLSWFDTVKDLLPTYQSNKYGDVDIYHLLCHSSGLPAHKEYWRSLEKIDVKKKRQWLIDEILSEKKVYKTGSHHLYSDLGYLLLGFIVEEKTDKDLACFWNESIAEPLGVSNQLLYPVPRPTQKVNFAATCSQDKKKLKGIVNDDNSRALGGITGHAGLFGTASGVLKVCQELLDAMSGRKSKLPISARTLNRACSRVAGSEWTAGFNTPSRCGSSSGKYFSEKSVGHLGFTGTSFWLDPVEQRAVVLLTNRVIKGENLEGIKELRPQIHNYIVEQLRLDKKVLSC